MDFATIEPDITPSNGHQTSKCFAYGLGHELHGLLIGSNNVIAIAVPP